MSDDGMAFVYPRFDEYFLKQSGAPNITWEPRRIDPDLRDSIYERQWQQLAAHRDEVQMIVLYSWNLYGERAQIEPSRGDQAPVGYWYVEKTRRYYDSFLAAENIVGWPDLGVKEPVDRMISYLHSQSEPELSLLREAPNAAPNTYWLYTDNYLAYQALRELEPDTATAIRSAMQKYKFEALKRYHVLDAACVAQRLFEVGHISKDVAISGDKRIRTDVVDPSVNMTDWQQYADRLLEAAINASNCGDKTKAQELFKKAQAMFDGVGMADKVHIVDGNYETYKVALYLIAAKRLGVNLPNKQELVNLILGLQDKDPSSNRYGGVRTHYSAPGSPLPGSDSNCETTSLCILALSP